MAPSDLAGQHNPRWQTAFHKTLLMVGHKLQMEHTTTDLPVELLASLAAEGVTGAIWGAARCGKLLVPALFGAGAPAPAASALAIGRYAQAAGGRCWR